MEKTKCTDNLFEPEQDLMTNTATAAVKGASPSIRIETSLPSTDGRTRKGLRGAAKITKTR